MSIIGSLTRLSVQEICHAAMKGRYVSVFLCKKHLGFADHFPVYFQRSVLQGDTRIVLKVMYLEKNSLVISIFSYNKNSGPGGTAQDLTGH